MASHRSHPRSRRSARIARVRATGGLLAVVFALTACGQKPGVHIAGSAGVPADQSGQIATGDGGGTFTDPATGETITTDTTTGGSFSDPSGTTTTGGTTTGGGSTTGGQTTDDGGSGGTTGGGSGGSTGGGSTGGGSGAPAQPQGSDRTGADAEKFTFAIHAPVTGAAPLPVTSFEKSRDLYWKHATGQGPILGRKEVEVLFRDDKYDPSSAVQVCREMASKAFMLVGGGGTDQIQACGRFANQAGVPYFSAGVTEAGLSGLPYYFASSMSYKQQGPLLAQYVKKNFGSKKVAAIVTNTPNFDDAVQGWEAGVQQAGVDYYKTLRHPKGDSSWYNSYASELKSAGVGVVYLNTAPVDYIRFAQQAAQQGFKPQYVGVGITMGLNAVLGSGCPQVDKGIFFSPFPGLDWARQNEAEFFQAGQKYGAPTDDIALALWGIAKQQHTLLERYAEVYGNDVTREDFRNVVEQQRGIETGVFPTVSYSPQDHFGASQVHVLQADCGSKQHKTLATFASGF